MLEFIQELNFIISLETILSEIYIFFVASTLLLLGIGYRNSEHLGYPFIVSPVLFLGVMGLIGSGLVLINLEVSYGEILFNGLICHDLFSYIVRGVALVVGGLILLASKHYLRSEHINIYEFTILVLLSILGIIFLGEAHDLIILYLGLELISLSFYVLAGSQRLSPFSVESAIKYYILGAFASCILLLGIAIIYIETGTTNFEELRLQEFLNLNDPDYRSGSLLGVVCIGTAFLFKLSAAPFHGWAPDVYEGAPTPVSILFSILPKLGIIVAFIRFFLGTYGTYTDVWLPILFVSAFASLIIGSILALIQKGFKRFLVYSSIGHIGFILLGLSTTYIGGIGSSLFYLFVYISMGILGWTLLLSLNFVNKNGRVKYLTDIGSLGKSNPVMAISFVLLLFSIAGVPPLGGFFGKFFVIFAALKGGAFFIGQIALLISVVSAYYYLRIIKILLFEKSYKGIPFFLDVGREKSLIIGSSLFFLMFFYFVCEDLQNISFMVSDSFNLVF